MRHWNATVHTLQSGETFLPLLLDDEDGVASADDWAIGFVRGMEMRRDSWSVLMDDKEHDGSLVPILALAHEYHPDPEMRPYKEPISAEMRERLIAGAAAGVIAIYHYFEAERLLGARARAGAKTFRRGGASTVLSHVRQNGFFLSTGRAVVFGGPPESLKAASD